MRALIAVDLSEHHGRDRPETCQLQYSHCFRKCGTRGQHIVYHDARGTVRHQNPPRDPEGATDPALPGGPAHRLLFAPGEWAPASA